MILDIIENDIYMKIGQTNTGMITLEHCSPKPSSRKLEEDKKQWYPLVEVKLAGSDQVNHRGSRHIGSRPGDLLKYKSHKDYHNDFGRKIEIIQNYENLCVVSHIQFFDGISIIRSSTELINESDKILPVEYVSSFALTGLKNGKQPGREKKSKVYLPHNTWYGEAQWKSYTMNELGYDAVNLFSMKKIGISSTGTWPSHEYLPMGSFMDEDENITFTWQIETSCSWNWEISDCVDELYLQLYGPTYDQNQFFMKLKPGQKWETVPAAIAFIDGDFEDSIREMTKYRRRIRRENTDNQELPVIFNDYMNCLFGDPTTEKLLPLIDAASQAGCDYFCVDAGWYDKGPWWDGIGEWLPSLERFPNGIEEPLNYIKSKGMIPGLWLEIEGIGINCPMVKKVPENWFFKRNGMPVIERSRYQLDFRNPEVREYAAKTIKRLVEDYKVGYIKMDYNVNFGPGTEYNSDSPGEGLLSHTKAYLRWLDDIFETYPELVIENCGSGGMRLTYTYLQKHSIQSVTDQTDYLKNAVIAANCMTAVTPEQAGIWSYPLNDGDEEETVFNMINAMLMRIHQSGHMAQMTESRLELVKEGIRCYKDITTDIKTGYPIWPIGLTDMSSEFLCTGISTDSTQYLAVWRKNGNKEMINIPLNRKKVKVKSVEVLYPKKLYTKFKWDNINGILTVWLKEKTARLFKIII